MLLLGAAIFIFVVNSPAVNLPEGISFMTSVSLAKFISMSRTTNRSQLYIYYTTDRQYKMSSDESDFENDEQFGQGYQREPEYTEESASRLLQMNLQNKTLMKEGLISTGVHVIHVL